MAFLLPIWFALQALPGEETCPSPVDVEAQVRSILHWAPERDMSESFLVERHEAGLYVELRGADSAVIGQRTLAYPPSQTCEEMAQAAAVVLAAWLSDVHPDFSGDLPPPETPPKPEPPPEAQKPPEPPKTPAVEAAAGAPPPPPRPRRAAAYTWDFGLAVGTDYAASKLALAGLADVALVPERPGIGLGLSVIPTTSRVQDLGPGHFSWRRWPIALGPIARLGALGLIWDVSAAPALAWLKFTEGAFDRSYQPGGLSWGGFGSLRASLRGRWGAFALVEAQVYPAKSTVYVTGVSQEWTLPRANIGLFLGARASP